MESILKGLDERLHRSGSVRDPDDVAQRPPLYARLAAAYFSLSYGLAMYIWILCIILSIYAPKVRMWEMRSVCSVGVRLPESAIGVHSLGSFCLSVMGSTCRYWVNDEGYCQKSHQIVLNCTTDNYTSFIDVEDMDNEVQCDT